MKLIRTKPDFTANEALVWLWIVGLSVALVPTLFGLSVGVASGFVVVIGAKKMINSYRLKPWARRLLRRET